MSRSFLSGANLLLPVWVVMSKYGEEPDERGRYFCPSHPDREGGTPSADVWQRDDGEVLACWSCGWSGGPLELIEKLAGIDAAEAGRIARGIMVDTPERVEGPLKGEPPSPALLQDELRRWTEGVRYPGDRDPVERFVEEKGNLPPVEWLKKEFGWIGDYRGRLVQPHRDYDGQLTGLRFRVPPDWDKRGRPHSQFQQLYGGWRAPRRGPLWLCEGETDCVYAAWHLEQRGIGTAVGIGSASQVCRPGDRAQFAGREAVIALDADAAGARGAARWIEALSGTASNIVMVKLPEGEDLRSCPPEWAGVIFAE